MLERRQQPRNRVYYGGMVAFNARNSTLACVVRNFSQRGAKIEFENSTMLPDGLISRSSAGSLVPGPHSSGATATRPAWCLSDVHETSDVIPLDLARKLRATERANRRLQSRLDQLLSEL